MGGEIQKLFVTIGAKTAGFEKGMDKVQGRMQAASKKMKIAGAAMIGAVAGIATASLKMAGDFDGAMREVNTMMLLNEDEFKAFSKEIQGLARDMGVDATEAANALYQAISAGVPKENAVDFLRIATKAAIGGVTDTKTAVDGLTSVMNAFKIPMGDAQKVADLMFTTVKGGKTTFEELSAAMFNVAPLAAAAGVKFETVSAALATMTKQGVPTSVATTQLRQAIQAIIKPTAEMKTALEGLGYASGDALIEEKGLAGALDLLTDASGGSNEVLGRMFGSVEGLQAVLALTGDNAQTFASDIDAMGNSAGAATDAFDQMEKSTKRQFEKLKVQMQDIAITIGSALMPALQKMLDTLAPIIEKVVNWISENPKLTIALLAGAAALGTLLMAIGPILKIIPALTVGIKAVGVAMGFLAANPIVLIIAAIAAVVAGVILLIKNWDKVKEKALAVWNFLKGFFQKVGEVLKKIFIEMTPVGLIIGHWDTIKTKASEIWGKITGFFKDTGNKIKNKFKSDWEKTKNFASKVWDKMTENSEKFGGGLKGNILSAMETTARGFKGWLDKMGIDTEGATEWIRRIWENILSFFREIPNKVRSAFSTLKDIMLAPFRFALRGIERAINWLIRQINRISVDIPNWVPGIGGRHFGFNIPSISLPSFQYGGIVPGPIGQAVPILAHGGEQFLGAGNTIGNNFYISQMVVREEADIQKIARELYRLQQRKVRLVGA